jgi:nucleotidyltransferase substrate binding protein (TIGR01987 family)
MDVLIFVSAYKNRIKKMSHSDIRWIQRFANFSKALNQLDKFMEKSESLNELEEQGLIQSFEYNFERALNLIKDYYEFQGETAIQRSRDAFRLAYRRELIEDGEGWMNMIESRTKTTHTYNKEMADEIVATILNQYYGLFKKLHLTMDEIIKTQV